MVYIRETAVFDGISLALRGAPPSMAVKWNIHNLGRHGCATEGGEEKRSLFYKKNFRRAMQITNMCLVLKLDNGKVVYIADEQTDGQTHPVRY